jgi:hypothetical protein
VFPDALPENSHEVEIQNKDRTKTRSTNNYVLYSSFKYFGLGAMHDVKICIVRQKMVSKKNIDCFINTVNIKEAPKKVTQKQVDRCCFVGL